MYLQVTWSNGAQTNFDVYDENMKKVAALQQHADLYVYIHCSDQTTIEGKHMVEGLDKLKAKIKNEALYGVKNS